MPVYRSELNPVDFLTRSAQIYPAKTAVVHGDRRYSYAAFSERVNRFA
jgi:fatty-acyl-CoA synthase